MVVYVYVYSGACLREGRGGVGGSAGSLATCCVSDWGWVRVGGWVVRAGGWVVSDCWGGVTLRVGITGHQEGGQLWP